MVREQGEVRGRGRPEEAKLARVELGILGSSSPMGSSQERGEGRAELCEAVAKTRVEVRGVSRMFRILIRGCGMRKIKADGRNGSIQTFSASPRNRAAPLAVVLAAQARWGGGSELRIEVAGGVVEGDGPTLRAFEMTAV